MAYMTVDLISPVIQEWMGLNKIRNTIVKSWPKKTINGFEVFDKLYIANNGHLIWPTRLSNEGRALNVLGQKEKDFANQDFSGADEVWLYFNKPDDVRHHFDLAGVQELATVSIGKKVILLEDAVIDNRKPVVGPSTSLKEKVLRYTVKSKTKIDEDFILALADNLSSTPSTYNIHIETIAAKNTGNVKIATYKIVYWLKNNPDYLECKNNINTLIDEKRYRNNNLTYDTNTISYKAEKLAEKYSPGLLGGTLIDQYYTSTQGIVGKQTETYYYLKVDEFADMTNKQLKAFLKLSVIDSDYNRPSKNVWDKVVEIFTIIAVAVLTVLSVVTTGGTTLQVVYALAAVALPMAVSRYYNILGNSYMAYTVNKASIAVGQATMLISFMVNFKQMINTAGKSGTGLLKQAVIKMVQHWPQTIDQVTSYYLAYRTKKEEDEINKVRRENQRVQDELNLMPTPKQYDIVMEEFDSYRFLDVNEYMDNMVYTVTQGRVDNSTRKYF